MPWPPAYEAWWWHEQTRDYAGYALARRPSRHAYGDEVRPSPGYEQRVQSRDYAGKKEERALLRQQQLAYRRRPIVDSGKMAASGATEHTATDGDALLAVRDDAPAPPTTPGST